MPNIRELDPSASPLHFYGGELRRLREEAGLSQKELGALVYASGSLVCQIETAHKVPTRPFTESVDGALKTGGALGRVLGLVLRSQLPSWFQPYADMESKATYICTYQAQVVDGLLQTPEYARAVLMSMGEPSNLDELVAARMERQKVLEREDPPMAWTVLDESVLHRCIGGPQVMRKQLQHLLDQQEVRIQVLPFSARQNPGLPGTFIILRFADDPDILYTEDLISGHMTANPEDIKNAALRYAHLQAAALSVEDSAALIKRVMEERYGDHGNSDGHQVA